MGDGCSRSPFAFSQAEVRSQDNGFTCHVRAVSGKHERKGQGDGLAHTMQSQTAQGDIVASTFGREACGFESSRWKFPNRKTFRAFEPIIIVRSRRRFAGEIDRDVRMRVREVGRIELDIRFPGLEGRIECLAAPKHRKPKPALCVIDIPMRSRRGSQGGAGKRRVNRKSSNHAGSLTSVPGTIRLSTSSRRMNW